MVFQDYDRDRSGQLDESEFFMAMRRLRVELEWISQIWAEGDDDGSGEVDISEFKALWVTVQERRMEERGEVRFDEQLDA